MLVLFRVGLPPNRTYPFPSTRLSSDYCVSVVVAVPVDQVVAVAADHEGLAARLTMPGPMRAAAAPAWSRSASVRTWCTAMSSVRLQSSHLPFSSRVTSSLLG